MTIRVAFYKYRGKPFNWLVSWKMSGPYSHVEAVLGNGEAPGTSCCASASFSDGGVRFKDIALRADRWDVIEVPGIEPAAVEAWFRAREGQPYDVRGLISFLLPVGNTAGGYFCNEAVGAACGVPEPHRFEPNNLACLLQRIGGVWVQGGPPWPHPWGHDSSALAENAA
jgi:hypothetical protein